MLETKIVYGLFNFLGIPAIILGVLSNMDNWKSVVLFFLAAILTCLKIAFYYIEKRQAQEERDMEIERKRIEHERWKKIK